MERVEVGDVARTECRWGRLQTRRYIVERNMHHAVGSGIPNCRNTNHRPASNLVRLIHIATVTVLQFLKHDRGSFLPIAELSVMWGSPSPSLRGVVAFTNYCTTWV
jgi:hypothetical protein